MPRQSALPPTDSQYEVIEMREKRFGFFPKRFCWRKREYVVLTIERTWGYTEGTPYLGFRVRCHKQTFELRQRLQCATWQLKSPRHRSSRNLK
jgi:hypothetical protein